MKSFFAEIPLIHKAANRPPSLFPTATRMTSPEPADFCYHEPNELIHGVA